MRWLPATILVAILPSLAVAQTCPFGQPAVGKSCSISDYTVGGAVAGSDAVAMQVERERQAGDAAADDCDV